MEAETIKLIAESAGRTAAERIHEQMRDDIIRLEERLSHSIESGFKTHFGEMNAADHVIQHDRLDRMLRLSDKITNNLWGKVVFGVIIIGLIAAVSAEGAAKAISKMVMGLFN